MKKSIKNRWVKALRSGKFKQGFGKLKQDEGDAIKYCCLGVAIEVFKPKNKKFSDFALRAGKSAFYAEDFCKAGCMPTRTFVKNVLELSKEEVETLAKLNDETSIRGDRMNDFHTVANYIEENL